MEPILAAVVTVSDKRYAGEREDASGPLLANLLRKMGAEIVPRDGVRRLCVRAPNWVGDVVMATPALRAIREHFPTAHVTLIVRPRVEPVLRCAPWFDSKLTYRPADGRAACNQDVHGPSARYTQRE